jgi:hypothetical protein
MKTEVVLMSLVGIAIVAFMAWMAFVAIPADRKANIEKNKEARAACIENGGKIIDYHGGSVFLPEWSCEGAMK